MSRLLAAQARLNTSSVTAARVLARDVLACEKVVAECLAVWQACQDVSDENPLAHECLRRLWFARDYLALAQAKAPASGAYPCQCGGSGIFSGATGTGGVWSGPCYGCTKPGQRIGKGWQDESDLHRNRTYWAKYARISI